MRFAAALSAPEELEPLRKAGADEVYLGLLEDSWRRLYGGHDIISRRQGKANLSRREHLKEVASKAQLLDMPVYLALNARYTEAQYPYLMELCRRYAEWGGTGVILQDMGLLLRLREADLPLRLTASLLAVTVNADGARFMKHMGVSRIVLPRFLTLAQMRAIASEVPDMEYEVMGMGDQCPMIDGLCRSFHGETFGRIPEMDGWARELCGRLTGGWRQDLRGAIGCPMDGPKEGPMVDRRAGQAVGPLDGRAGGRIFASEVGAPFGPDGTRTGDRNAGVGGTPSDQYSALFTTFDTSCAAHHLCAGLPRKSHPCAACDMDVLDSAGIGILKFGGRGTPLETRLRDLRFFSFARNSNDRETIRNMYRETYGHECECYYS